MTSTDRRPLRPLLLLPLSLLLLLPGVLTPSATNLGSDEFPICSVPCCNVTPSCRAARAISCRCPEQLTIVMSEGCVPKTVQKIIVHDTKLVIIDKDAFANLMSLSSIHLYDIGGLQLKRSSLKLPKKTRIMSFTVENVSTTVRIAGSAFSGFWRRDATVTFRLVKALMAEENGFNFKSLFDGPKLVMAGIKQLNLSEGAIGATIRQVIMSNVGMLECRSNSFGEHITRIEMYDVQAQQLGAICIASSGALESFSLNSCHFGIINTDGISGKIQNVIIHDTNITRVEERGFRLAVDNLLVTACSFGEIKPEGLSVTARKAIRWNQVTIDFLRKNAFINMQMSDAQTTDTSDFLLQALTVKDGEFGSLKFGGRSKPRLYQLNVIAPAQFLCLMESWIRTLLGKGEREPLNEAETQLIDNLTDDRSCLTTHQKSNVTLPTVLPSISLDPPEKPSGNADDNQKEETTVSLGDTNSVSGRSDVALDVVTADGSDVTQLTLAVTLGAVAVMVVAVVIAVMLLFGPARRRRRHIPLALEMTSRLGEVGGAAGGEQRPPADPGTRHRRRQDATPAPAGDHDYEVIGGEPLLPAPSPPPYPPPRNPSAPSVLPFIEDRTPDSDYRPAALPVRR